MKVLQKRSYNGVEVDVEVQHYGNGRLAIELTCKGDEGFQEPYLTATTNLVDEDCPSGEVWVKNWSENEGITQWLIEQQIIEQGAMDNCQTGYVQAQRYRLHERFLEALAQAAVAAGERSRR